MNPVERTLSALVKREKQRKPPAPLPRITIPTKPPASGGNIQNWKALVRGRWPVYFEELWEERAAIMTFEGGLAKEEAEAKAYHELVSLHDNLKKYEEELLTHERDPRVTRLRELFPVKLFCLEWKK